MAWYAIRSVYLFGVKEDGTNVFEERVVAFEAEWVARRGTLYFEDEKPGRAKRE